MQSAVTDVTTDQAGVDLRQQFNRLTLGMRASVLTREVADTTAADGTQISNRDRDLTATEQAARTTWAFKPTLQAFAEVATNQRDFRAAPVSDGMVVTAQNVNGSLDKDRDAVLTLLRLAQATGMRIVPRNPAMP